MSDKNVSNGKLFKDRITVTNGMKKYKLFVIGKSENPRCIKNVKSLPVKYYNNKA